MQILHKSRKLRIFTLCVYFNKLSLEFPEPKGLLKSVVSFIKHFFHYSLFYFLGTRIFTFEGVFKLLLEEFTEMGEKFDCCFVFVDFFFEGCLFFPVVEIFLFLFLTGVLHVLGSLFFKFETNFVKIFKDFKGSVEFQNVKGITVNF